MRTLLAIAVIAQSIAPVTFEERSDVMAVQPGRNAIITCQGPASSQLCIASAYLIELPQSPRDGVKPTCTDAAQGYVWFTRGSAAADSRTEVCEWRSGTIAWRVK